MHFKPEFSAWVMVLQGQRYFFEHAEIRFAHLNHTIIGNHELAIWN
jgi:hypothetical protein